MSCQVCWRTMRRHNGRSRRSPNLYSEAAYQGRVTKKDEGAAHSIQARRSLLQQRPNTFAQTNTLLSTFACKTAADHTFRVVLCLRLPGSGTLRCGGRAQAWETTNAH